MSFPHEAALVSVLAEARPDLLSHAITLLRRRAFKVLALTVGGSENELVARLTIRVAGPPREGERLRRELRRWLYVLAVEDLSEKALVERELALIKVKAGAAERAQIAQLCEVFRARLVDVARESVMVEATGDADKIHGLLEVLRPFGLLEMARSGPVALSRSDQALRAEAPASSWLERRLAAIPNPS